ncbi:hypothetical protein HanIR_Chr02g0065611 [Helianthus annuus]|nr:hypothetical protein HanIR_Chr02g0065611 [Helianthus annuus]
MSQFLNTVAAHVDAPPHSLLCPIMTSNDRRLIPAPLSFGPTSTPSSFSSLTCIHRRFTPTSDKQRPHLRLNGTPCLTSFLKPHTRLTCTHSSQSSPTNVSQKEERLSQRRRRRRQPHRRRRR